jgi:Heparinase II/III-like protein/Heparinase II/III N-terminus
MHSIQLMTNPIDKIKKIRSWDEIRTRGSQAVSAYREKMGRGGSEPTDAEFEQLLDRAAMGSARMTPEGIWYQFYSNADDHFFASMTDRKTGVQVYRREFPESAEHFIASADAIVTGRIDILGYRDVYIGEEVDWHFEPVSGIRSPKKHWREFDDNDAAEAGDKKVIWELNRHQHFFTLGLAFWLTGDERYTDTFVRHLDSWMDQNPSGIGVNWASSLEVSFRAMSWIWAIQFFRQSEHFSAEMLLRVAKYLYLHGRHIEKYLSKYYSPNTHLTGEALGLYYIGTQLPFLADAAGWRVLGEQILFGEITRQVFPDGVYFEQSTWYQRYTVDFYEQFVVLRSLNDAAIEGAPATALERRLEAALEFMMHVTRPDGTTPAIGDVDGGRALPLTAAAPNDFRGTLAAGAAILARGDMKYVAGPSNEEIFWLFGPDGMQARRLVEHKEPENTSAAFPSGGYYTMRDGWLETDKFLVIDCGPVGALSGGHGHADTLSIDVSIKGRPMLIDPGTYSYHESREMRDHFRSTAAHNTLTLDGHPSSVPGSTFNWQTRAAAAAHVWVDDQRFSYFEGSHDGFEQLENPARHERGVLFLKNDYIVIRDMVRAKGEHTATLNYHFPAGHEISVDTNEMSIGDHGSKMILVGDGGELHIAESATSLTYGVKADALHLKFSATARGTQELFTFILPTEDGFESPTVREVPVYGARAFAINYLGYTDLLIYNDDEGHVLKTEVFDTDFHITWARIGTMAATPEEYVLIGGSKFDLGGQIIIGGSRHLDHAAARQVGRGINVRTRETHFRVQMA